MGRTMMVYEAMALKSALDAGRLNIGNYQSEFVEAFVRGMEIRGRTAVEYPSQLDALYRCTERLAIRIWKPLEQAANANLARHAA
ncbi:MAG: hypothetical protein MO853_11155 [Candidatus Protistobacter heckmanni]|nr:hypothetical protein [Candidatus Protistobacter heckmanni]